MGLALRKSKKLFLKYKQSENLLKKLFLRFHKFDQVNNFMHLINTNLLKSVFKDLKSTSLKRRYSSNLDINLNKLLIKLKAGKFKYSKKLREIKVMKADGSMRIVYEQSIEEKIIDKTLYVILSLYYESQFQDFSFAYRIGKSTKHAIQYLIRKIYINKLKFLYKIDIEKFFDNIDANLVKKLLSNKFKDRSFIKLLQSRFPDKSNQKIQGTVLGALISNFFADLVIDTWFSEAMCNRKIMITRYSDDLIIGSNNIEDLELSFSVLKKRLSNFKLNINSDKVEFIDLEKPSFVFLGYQVSRYRNRLQITTPVETIGKVIDKLREFMSDENLSHTERIYKVNNLVRTHIDYFYFQNNLDNLEYVLRISHFIITRFILTNNYLLSRYTDFSLLPAIPQQ
ncbi:MAG: hypothetical protein HRT47_01840 [Candidatus Caenarcaniphilales bacterium]|nr:hypothetical protein [Candidatus Caenarcaniphilales bacterium]